jgi:hypothetical protein
VTGGVKTKGPKLLKVTGEVLYNWFTMTENLGFIKDVLITDILSILNGITTNINDMQKRI